MKQRITYLLPEGSQNDPSDIQVERDSLNFSRANKTAEEWRVTLSINDLPDEVQVLLKDCHELHIRWTSPLNRPLLPPVVSRLPAGLHVFFTPRTSAQKSPDCDLIHKLIGVEELKCDTVIGSLIRAPVSSERVAASSTYQYYTPTKSDQQIGDLFLSKLCNSTSQRGSAIDACDQRLQELESASHIDVDVDAISHAVVFTAFWSEPYDNPRSASRPSRSIRKSRAEGRIEIGVLESQQATESGELSLGGYLIVLGQDDRPGTTLFSFPSRHHPLPLSSPATFRASFQHPTGLHPKFELKLKSQYMAPPKDNCGLHAYWTLPSTLFIDRYQLSDPLFLASQNLVELHSLYGEQDLEAPDWVIKQWGSAALFQLVAPTAKLHRIQPPPFDWTVTIPTHLRYVNRSQHDSYHADKAVIDVPWPVLFWACEAEEDLKMSTNPFDRINLGYDGLFGPKTIFYHIPPAGIGTKTIESIRVPVLNSEDARWVQLGTLIAVVVGFLWICLQLLRNAKLSSPTHYEKNKMQ